MIDFVRKYYRKFFAFFMWLTLILCTLCGGIAGYSAGDNIFNVGIIGAVFGAIAGGFVGFMIDITGGGFVATIISIDESLEAIKAMGKTDVAAASKSPQS